jgi:hypothetical protein
MQKRHVVLACMLLAPSYLTACSTDEANTLAVSNERLEEPASTDEGEADEVTSGPGRSRVSLGVLGIKEMRSAFLQVYQQGSLGSPERIYLSYSAVFVNGNALSLQLPYAGSATILNAASFAIGGDGLMWSLNGDADMFSTRGSFRIEPTDNGIAVHIADLILAKPLGADETIAIDDGVIEGQLERRCLLAKPTADGLTGPNGPAIDYEPDMNWTSEFCSAYR